ncbi:hypothetical protein [Rubellicoccus peritrichatus]|uniref:Mannose-6-phosphate isomerase n=1 Tax=Rubellicoccus peritrichatus TaxID=3080537 RepID=A0AAQ3QV68_9BACT|nr:hypothetical protein [Puniceicoccus sp. CR14]WOO41223.1 hypothetical protein RZN69_21590 [Puniceicoccus sp. CR14]
MMTPSISLVSKIPLRLKPNRVWRSYRGGKLLDTLEGNKSATDSHFPEDWIGSAVEAINPEGYGRPGEGLSTVQLQDHEEQLLHLFNETPVYFFGQEHVERYGNKPEFLVKFIDSAEQLHFQCHPTKAFSKEKLRSPYGKFEAYYVLQVRPDSEFGEVYLGFQRPPERDQLKKLIEEQRIGEIAACFDPVKVRPGDVIVVPGGTPHALGAGVLLIEILEPSDWVVRFEFSRGDFVLPQKDRFMGRDLEFALDVFDLESKSQQDINNHFCCKPRTMASLPNAKREALIGPDKTDCFVVWKTSWSGHVRREVKAFCIIIVLKGECRLGGADGQTELLNQYDRVIVPHGLGFLEMEASEDCEILECYPPHSHPEKELFVSC